MTNKSAEQRAEEANIRTDIISSMSPQERLDRLDARLGKDQGAHRERMRLEKLIATAKATQ